MEEKKCAYTIWGWNEAPSGIRLSAPWDSGTWIVTYEPGYTFPYHVLNVNEHPEWDVYTNQIGGVFYTFINTKEPWPEFIEHTLYDWGSPSKSFTSGLSSTIITEIDCPSKD